MGTSRILKRASEKEKIKTSKRKLKEIAKVVDSAGKRCLDCQTDFNPKDGEMLDTWMVQVFENSAVLRCPTCFEKNSNQGA